jgi:putative PIN family toxin of toxin-antitoxin system
LRVVIDPNVWVSGLINPYGAPARVIEAVAVRLVTAVATRHLLDELAEVVGRPRFRRWFSLADASASVEALEREADVRTEPAVMPQRVRDPDDDYLAALADDAGAVIVTGDADLLEADLAPAAITPRSLLERLGWT